MKILVLGGLVFMMMISACYGINNLQLRGCIDDSTAEDHGQCYTLLRNCFEVQECGNEFTELFADCQIPLDDKDFNLECFLRGQKRVEHVHNKELIKCFDEVCGMFGGNPTADLDLIYKNIVKNLEEKKLEQEQNQERSESEEFQCIKKALTDPEKCYKLADDCDEECSADLDKLKSCSGEDDSNCIYDIQGALPLLVQEKAIKLTTCLAKECYQGQDKTQFFEKQNKQPEHKIVEEL